MIHEVRIENFYSVREQITLRLAVPGNVPKLDRFPASRSRPHVRLPAVVTLFGPNGSGKTTILRALTAVIRFMVESFGNPPDAPVPGFKPFFHDEWLSRPTRISADFDAEWLSVPAEGASQLFRYELEVAGSRLGSQYVLREALIHFPRGHPRRLFERRKDQPIRVAREFGSPRELAFALRKLEPHRSVLSTLRHFEIPLAQTIGNDLSRLQSNLWRSERTTFNDETVLPFYRSNPGMFDAVNRDLQRIDVGIAGMELRESGNGRLSAGFRHDRLAAPVEMAEESSGTRHFIRLYPLIQFVLGLGHVALFDEFDADLHPELIREIFRWFQEPERNPHKAQLFATLHNATLLDHLEKEEVWLVEKDENGATRVQACRDFEGLRRGVSLFNKYTGGELGALPVIG